jgi:hypothetical protein
MTSTSAPFGSHGLSDVSSEPRAEINTAGAHQ